MVVLQSISTYHVVGISINLRLQTTSNVVRVLVLTTLASDVTAVELAVEDLLGVLLGLLRRVSGRLATMSWRDGGEAILGLLRLALWPPTMFPGFDMLIELKLKNQAFGSTLEYEVWNDEC